MRFRSMPRQTVALSQEQDFIHAIYLTWIEPLIEYDSIDAVVQHKRRHNSDKKDAILIDEVLQIQVSHKAKLMSYVVKKWIGDEDLRQQLRQIRLLTTAVCSYELFRKWGEANPDHAIGSDDVMYNDWQTDLAKEDKEKSLEIARCITVLLKQSLFCDVSLYPNLQQGLKDVVTCRNRLTPQRPIDLT